MSHKALPASQIFCGGAGRGWHRQISARTLSLRERTRARRPRQMSR